MGALSSLATIGLNFALANQAAKRESRTANQERDRRIREIQERDAEERREQEARLKRELASQRARAAAAGVGDSSSSAAVLRGLVEETEAALQARERQSASQIGDLRRDARQARRRNLLDLTTDVTRSSFRTLSRSSARRGSLLDL